MRSERPCALRDRSGGPGKHSGQVGGSTLVTYQTLRNAPDPKTPPSGVSAKLPPITFPPYAKIALVHD
eukprot:272589-Prymnesium_polylepis.1